MEAKKAIYPIAVMARVLGVTCQGYYQWRAHWKARHERVLARGEFDRVVACAFEDYQHTHGAARLVLCLPGWECVRIRKPLPRPWPVKV